MILLMYGLLVFGVFMIESAARHVEMSGGIDPGLYFSGMQKKWVILGSFVYFTVALVDYRWVRWFGLPVYFCSLGLMVLVMFSDKSGVYQLQVGGVKFQPVQFGMASGILLISWLLNDAPKWKPWLGAPITKLILVGIFTGIPCLLAVKMGDMGSALVWMPVAAVALVVSGVPFRYLGVLFFTGVGFLPLLYFVVLPKVSERGPQRIEVWLRMLQGKEVDTLGDAYAAYRVTMAVGKSGWKGVGWNAGPETGSLHARGWIPKDTAHNDYIFAVIAEELGYRGSLMMITAFSALLILSLFAAYHSRDVLGRMLCCMVVGLFFAHIFENVGMCVLLLPITGIPLPLISYSGTFVLICMFLLGMVQSVWVHRRVELSETRK